MSIALDLVITKKIIAKLEYTSMLDYYLKVCENKRTDVYRTVTRGRLDQVMFSPCSIKSVGQRTLDFTRCRSVQLILQCVLRHWTDCSAAFSGYRHRGFHTGY